MDKIIDFVAKNPTYGGISPKAFQSNNIKRNLSVPNFIKENRKEVSPVSPSLCQQLMDGPEDNGITINIEYKAEVKDQSTQTEPNTKTIAIQTEGMAPRIDARTQTDKPTNRFPISCGCCGFMYLIKKLK